MELQLYKFIVEDIKSKIVEGILNPGDKLPTEQELTDLYDASKSTVRKSMGILSNAGYIYSVPRIGNFVNLPKSDDYLLVFDELKHGVSEIDEVKTLSINTIKTHDLDGLYELPFGDSNAFEIKRIFLTLSMPIAYDIIYIFFSKGLTIKETELEKESLLEVLSKKISLFHIEKDIKIMGCVSDAALAEILQTKEKEPLLKIEHRYWDKYNKIIAVGTTYYKGDSIQLSADSIINK